MKNISFKDQFTGYGRALKTWITEEWPKESPQDIRIGLWGTRGSGKTTYLAMLYEALSLSNDWEVSLDSKARRFVRDHCRTINSDCIFPEPTQVANELEIFSFTLRPQFKGKYSGKVVLNFIDAPGEFYEILNADARVVGANGNGSEYAQKTMDIVDYLISCDGIIFLLDPERSQEEGDTYSMLIEDLILEFQERSQQSDLESERLQQYMAFTVAKADQESLWRRIESPAQLAQEIVGKRLFEKLEKNHCYVDRKNPANNRFAFFAVSSVGRYQDKDGNWQTPVVEPEEPTSSTSTYEHGFGSDPTGYSTLNSAYNPPQNMTERLKTNKADNRNQTPQSLRTLQRGVDARPFQIIDPINWLVKGIQENPPVRPQQK
jgi:Double-GTPase 2